MTPSREYVVEANCLAAWLEQTIALFSVAYLHTIPPTVPLCARKGESLVLGIAAFYTYVHTT